MSEISNITTQLVCGQVNRKWMPI